MRGGEGAGLLQGDAVPRPRHHRSAAGNSGLAGGGLRSHHADGIGRRADEDQAGILAGGGEIGVLAEKPVAGVDGVGAAVAGGGQNAVGAEVTLRGRRRPHGAASSAMRTCKRGAVGLGIDRHGGDAHFPQRADDTDGDLAAIGDQNLAEHGSQNCSSRQGAPSGAKGGRLRRPEDPAESAYALGRS